MEDINNKLDDDKGINMESISEMIDNNIPVDDNGNELSCEDDPFNKKTSDSIISEELKNEMIESLNDMNYVELFTMKRDMLGRIEQLHDAQKVVTELLKTKDQLKTMKTKTKEKKEDDSDTDDISQSIAISNLEDSTDLDNDEESLKNFIDSYDVAEERLNEVIAITEEKIKEYDDTEKTATFMNKCMVEIADKHLKDLDTPDKYDNISKDQMKIMKGYYNNMKKIYTDRDNVDWIVERIKTKQIMLRRFVQSVKKDFKAGKENCITGAQISASKAFGSVFSMKQMQSFDNYLKELYNPEDDENDFSVFLTQYALYLIYTDDKPRKYGQHKWVEALIMNVLNVLDDLYDMPNGVNYLNNQLMIIRETVMDGMPKI